LDIANLSEPFKPVNGGCRERVEEKSGNGISM